MREICGVVRDASDCFRASAFSRVLPGVAIGIATTNSTQPTC